jgi:peptidoglycan hydrolase-like protein with peptidoglycan-binding domain
MIRRVVPLLVMAVALAAPGAAAGQAPPAEEAPSAAPAPPPKAKLALKLVRVGSGGVLAGRRWAVRGTVRPYVPGQRVTVRFHRRGKKIAARRLVVRRAGSRGTFVLGFRARTPGRITVSASHRRTAQLGTARARPVQVEVLPLRATPGAKGLAVRVLQARLARLGYVVGQRGVYDDRTARAVTAFRKLTGMRRTNIASEEVFRRLARGEGRFRVRFPQHGRHVEANISRQVLALIENGRAVRIYPTSTGAPATPTILGTYRVYMKAYGTNAKGMVHSSYFIRGYAIHGYASVPVYNASHGCLRVPVPDALSIFNWVRHGTIVDTYR